MTRTSLTHPLAIAAVPVGEGMGRIGITFCPGKKQASAWTGAWDRDLGLDAAIAERGAAAVVTLVEDHELCSLQVQGLGQAVRDAHMDWLHLPIVDVSVPCSRFEAEWREVGEGLRNRLRHGFDVVVHCKGGLGRAGTIAARLLVELGWQADRAIEAVRKARPGAIEVSSQEAHVRATRAIPSRMPSGDKAAVRDRAMGALVGLAVGDTVGTTLEFKRRDSYPRLTDMTGGGPFRLRPGQWTDDTAMALALADSLLAHPELDERDLMRRFLAWWRQGAYSCTGTCFDIGMTVSSALARFERTGDPIAGSSDPHTAGNGSLMRLAPVAVRHWADPERLVDVARRQSATTHGAPEALAACEAYALLLAEAIAGLPRAQVLAPRKTNYPGAIAPILAGSWRGRPRGQIRASGYVAHSLEAALWSVGRTASFADAVLTAANLGEDADTTAAIAGQLAGALYGVSGIPEAWKAKLAWREKIIEVGDALWSASRTAELPDRTLPPG
jgi:ADP-ribosyl-[dinitrogen reductase] hydrolase